MVLPVLPQGEGFHMRPVRSTPMHKAPVVTEEKKRIITTHHNYSYSMFSYSGYLTSYDVYFPNLCTVNQHT